MKTLTLAVLFAATLAFARAQNSNKPVSHTRQSLIYDYTLKEIYKGIYVSVREEPLREAVEGNFVFIVNNKDVVVVDAGGSAQLAKKAIRDLKKITNNPVSFLVNTHFHGDHTFGNQEYKRHFPEAEIIASEATFQVMRQREVQQQNGTFKFYLLDTTYFEKKQAETDSLIQSLDNQKYALVIENLKRYRNDDMYQLRTFYKEIRITPPTVFFDTIFHINRPIRQIQLMHLGRGDTPGDVWVYLPDEKILISGDAVVHPIPYGFTKDPVSWIRTLEKAEQLDFEILIPGHGQVQYGKTYLRELLKLLKSILTEVEKLTSEKKSSREILASLSITTNEAFFTRNDPFLSHYFDEYFREPLLRTLLKEEK